jgi:hypothetical protein
VHGRLRDLAQRVFATALEVGEPLDFLGFPPKLGPDPAL